MRTLLREFRTRPLAWTVPLVVVFGALAWLAWATVHVPSVPLTYRIDF